MPDFTVDVGGLDALSKNLRRCVESLNGALTAMRDVGPESLGAEDLDQACADFREDWEYGLSKIREFVDNLGEGLDKVRQNYAEVEAALSKGFSSMRDQLGGAR